MFSRVYSGGLTGIDAYRIEVEVDCSGGMGQMHIVGLPDAAVKESQERVKAAIKSCDIYMPQGKKWIINLAPADTKKEGPSFDLPIAVGVLSASGQFGIDYLSNFWMVGELGLDGSVRGINGVLPIALSCRAEGMEGLIIPEANSSEAELIEGVRVYPVSHLKQVIDILRNPSGGAFLQSNAREIYNRARSKPLSGLDFADVKGQKNGKKAMTVVAAGRHNILMVGPPGSGKSMLAQRLPGILPPMEFEEALQVTKLYSVSGLLSAKRNIITERPFRSPHHSASLSGLIGGGSWPRPGEISLSHLGVLFLDELTEFPRQHIDAFRQPLESGVVTISRANQTLSYPAQFLLVGACNPCPCGFKGDQVRVCICSQHQADKYWAKLSGPFMDRIDLHIDVGRLSDVDLKGTGDEYSSEMMRLQMARAVEIQRNRFGDGEQFMFNGQLDRSHMKRFCRIDSKSQELLTRAVTSLGLSARAYDRILRISRTVADLESSEEITLRHVLEAISYRTIRKV